MDELICQRCLGCGSPPGLVFTYTLYSRKDASLGDSTASAVIVALRRLTSLTCLSGVACVCCLERVCPRLLVSSQCPPVLHSQSLSQQPSRYRYAGIRY